MRESLQQKIDAVKHLYPKCQYPEKADDWTVGHTCLQQIEELMMPREKMLMASWVADVLIVDWLHGHNCPSFKEFKKVYDSVYSEMEYIKICRDKWAEHPMERNWRNIRDAGVWNCEECAYVAHQWFNARQIPHQMMDFLLIDTESNTIGDAHCFIAFSPKNLSACRLFETAAQQLADQKDMYILDVWLGQCMPARRLLQTYANLFKYDLKEPVSPAPIIQPAQVQFEVGDSLRRLYPKMYPDYFPSVPKPQKYVIGGVTERNGKRFFVSKTASANQRPVPFLTQHQNTR